MLFTKRNFWGGMKAINWGSVFQITNSEVRNLREKIQIIHTMRERDYFISSINFLIRKVAWPVRLSMT